MCVLFFTLLWAYNKNDDDDDCGSVILVPTISKYNVHDLNVKSLDIPPGSYNNSVGEDSGATLH